MLDYNDNVTRQITGTADSIALLSAAFSYPDAALVDALLNEAFQSDLQNCFEEMSMRNEGAELCAEITASIPGTETEVILDSMRAEYTRLYYGLGKLRIISPYEPVYRKLEADPHAKRPTAFITKSTHDVESYMEAYGVLPESARREPVDHFTTELDFLRHLFTGYLAQYCENGDTQPWSDDIQSFLNKHILNWIPSLLNRTRAESNLAIYQAFADFGLTLLRYVEEHYQSNEAEAFRN